MWTPSASSLIERPCSQEKPRTARKTPKTPQIAITASASRFSLRGMPVTIAPDSPLISGYSGRASAIVRRKPGALLESKT